MERKTTLRELREQSGKTRAEVANALGVTPNAITNYEYGKRRLSLEQVLLLLVLGFKLSPPSSYSYNHLIV